MECGLLKDIEIYVFIREHQDNVIIFGYGGADITINKGHFKKSQKEKGVKGPNADLCNEIVDCAEVSKKSSLQLYYVKGTAEEMRRLLNSPGNYFRIVE